MSAPPRWLWLLVALVFVAIWHHAHRPIAHAPGILVEAAPTQAAIDGNVASWQKAGATIKPLATFSISARVLSRADYHWDQQAALVPVDLALGWGRMSDSAILEKVDVSQSGRFYYWRVREFPIPEHEIIASSANMHLIAADRTIEREIARARIGDIVSFDGYLVEADSSAGGRWVSSLTRNDSGPGACELVWVEHFDIAPRD